MDIPRLDKDYINDVAERLNRLNDLHVRGIRKVKEKQVSKLHLLTQIGLKGCISCNRKINAGLPAVTVFCVCDDCVKDKTDYLPKLQQILVTVINRLGKNQEVITFDKGKKHY